MDAFRKGSPSKLPALFRMRGWAKPKVLTEEEKQDIFAREAEDRRDTADDRVKRERQSQMDKDARRKEGQNERQRRHRQLKRAAEEANPSTSFFPSSI